MTSNSLFSVTLSAHAVCSTDLGCDGSGAFTTLLPLQSCAQATWFHCGSSRNTGVCVPVGRKDSGFNLGIWGQWTGQVPVVSRLPWLAWSRYLPSLCWRLSKELNYLLPFQEGLVPVSRRFNFPEILVIMFSYFLFYMLELWDRLIENTGKQTQITSAFCFSWSCILWPHLLLCIKNHLLVYMDARVNLFNFEKGLWAQTSIITIWQQENRRFCL